MKLEVLIQEFTVPKKTHFGTLEKSTGQDKVYVKTEAGAWRHVGYIGHASLCFTGLVDFPVELGPAVAEECSRQKKLPIRFGGAPETVVEMEENEDDE